VKSHSRCFGRKHDGGNQKWPHACDLRTTQTRLAHQGAKHKAVHTRLDTRYYRVAMVAQRDVWVRKRRQAQTKRQDTACCKNQGTKRAKAETGRHTKKIIFCHF